MGFYYLVTMAIALTGGIIRWLFKGKFSEFSKLPTISGLSGKEVAEKMLLENNISDVSVVMADGAYADFYDPGKKTITLSTEVYNGRSMASAAIASHEGAHAIQHNSGYVWLYLRNLALPFISFISSFVPWVLLAGILMMQIFPQLFIIGIWLFSVSAIFCFLTLPVELDASKRALGWLKKTNIDNDQAVAKRALNWAALSYGIIAIASLAILLFYIIDLIAGHQAD